MEIRNSSKPVSPAIWDEVWIIAGGPSARSFDVNRLLWDKDEVPKRPRQVLAVNDAVFRFAWPVPVFSLDNTWVRRHRKFLETYAGEKYIALPKGVFSDCEGIQGVQYLDWSHADGLSEDPTVVCTGCHSGYAAINFAFLRGAKKMHLYGYDLDPASTHVDASQYPFWAKAFDTMRPQLEKHGVVVLNHNLDSHVTAFPKVEDKIYGHSVDELSCGDSEGEDHRTGDRSCERDEAASAAANS